MSLTTPLSRLSVCLVLALGAAGVLRADLGARQGRGQGAAPPAVDVVPTSTMSIAKNPAAFLGKVVSVTASVGRAINATVFTVDQNRNTADGELLVIAPALYTMPAPDAYVTVIGNLVAFDPADVATRLKGYTLTIPLDVAAKFQGKPTILATAIVGSNMADLTKRPPAPMTPDDEKLSAIMKQVSPASAALRTAAGTSDAAAVKARTAELKKLFTDAQVVFKGRNMMTALIWADDAIKATDAADAAAATAKWPEVTAATGKLSETCTACHNAHRERQDDGTYRIK